MPITISTATTTAPTATPSRRGARPPTWRSPGPPPTATAGRTRRGFGRTVWFGVVVAAICFEGMGRKFLPEAPGVVFYFAKDVVLAVGLLAIGISSEVAATARQLIRGFLPVIPVAFAWTLVEMLNPSQTRFELALLGIRSYWLWWLAPLVVASALRESRDRARAMVALGFVALIVGGFALVQFSLPPDHPLNRYAWSTMDVATVGSTGRARVSSTFSYLTGFTDFVVIVPALLLSVGLAMPSRRGRALMLAATAVCAVSLPASGSRGPVLLATGALAMVAYASGLVWTRQGRRVLIAGAVSLGAILLFSRGAVEGVHDRFVADPEETGRRLMQTVAAIPPFALTMPEYPILGTGTGSCQNAATSLGIAQQYDAEGEPFRLVVEQGVLGYLLVSLVRIGLLVALARAGLLLKRAGMNAEAGGAWALASLTLTTSLVFDHVAQALFFVGAGIVLESVVRARRATVRG